MNFYNYLKNKTLLFESTINGKYYYDGKKVYPISNNKFSYIEKEKLKTEEINKNGDLLPNINGRFLIENGENIKIKSIEKIDKKENEDNQEIIRNNQKIIKNNQYIKIDNLYYPIFKIKDKYVYIKNDDIVEIILNDPNNKFEEKNTSISKYYKILSNNNSSNSTGSSGSSSELPEDLPNENSNNSEEKASE